MVSCSGAGLRPAQARPDTGDQLLGLERLHDVVVGAGLQSDHHVHRVALGCEHDDRYTGLRPDQAAHFDSVAARQHLVEKHQVRLGLTEGSESLVAVSDERGFEAFTAQHNPEHFRQCGVVVDDENASLHYDIIPLAHRYLA